MDTATLARLRAITARYMTDTCTIEAQVKAQGKYREEHPVWQTLYTGLRCRLITIGTRNNNELVLSSDRESIRETYKLIVPYDTALAIDQRVTIRGKTYTVVSIMTERSETTDAQAIMERLQ